jgi:hypothetical protein
MTTDTLLTLEEAATQLGVEPEAVKARLRPVGSFTEPPRHTVALYSANDVARMARKPR